MGTRVTSAAGRVRLDSRDDGVWVMVLDNPPFNALTTAMCDRALDLLGSLREDPSVRALVVTGSSRAFSAGADLAELRAGGDPVARLTALVEAIGRFPVPVIAAVDGPAAGGGLEIALACDLRVVSADATFSASAVNMGLIAGWYRLPRLVGLARATEMVLTGQRYAAADLAAWGLVRIAGPDGAGSDAEELAGRIASRAPLSVRVLTHALRMSLDLDRTAADQIQAESLAPLRASADHAEAVAAFLEKRPPRFNGR
jgi:enoyl-CoA hydratase